ncbi:MAG: FliH/SctL family protein [Planctomycetota bacterium]
MAAILRTAPNAAETRASKAALQDVASMAEAARRCVEQAREEAELLMRAARAEAESIRAHAFATGHLEGREAGRLEGLLVGRDEGREQGRQTGIEEGRQQGRAEGREEGLTAGRAEGREAGWLEGRAAGRAEMESELRTEFAHQLAAAPTTRDRMIDGLRRAQCDWLYRWECDAIGLACAIAARIARREFIAEPRLTIGLVRESLQMIAGRQRARLLLHPRDMALLGEEIRQLANSLGRQATVEITADESIEPGGCRVVTDWGDIDQQLSTQLARIAEELGVDE